MSHRTLQVSSREGRPSVAYLFLPRDAGDCAAATDEVAPGLLLDRRADGRAIGSEILKPGRVTLDGINEALRVAGQPPAEAAEIRPLAAA